MISIEQVEKLLEYADVTFEEARDALETCKGNLLDAIVYLERQGKVTPRGGARAGSVTVLPGNAQEGKNYKQPKGEDFTESVHRFFKWLGEQFDKMGGCVFIASHKNEKLISMPALIFWGITIFGFYFMLPTLLIGAACGVTYRFEDGNGVNTEDINNSGESEKL